ncbi:Hypothetical predicted protein [Octopus vulgaris]|uniref:Uncharacterized protein n=1 Tax=Octopus vulgaris TaxID=6645 RepID=A0AA36C184_OCTVU|nr:Hypothetical predicted protein [Octopus vulgaris]
MYSVSKKSFQHDVEGLKNILHRRILEDSYNVMEKVFLDLVVVVSSVFSTASPVAFAVFAILPIGHVAVAVTVALSDAATAAVAVVASAAFYAAVLVDVVGVPSAA